MKSFNFRILLISGFCFLFLTANIFAQKNKDQDNFETSPVETKVETKSDSDSSSKSSSDSSSTSTSSESKSDSSSTSTSTTSSDTSSSDSGSSSSSSSGSSRASRNEADQRNRREGQAREKERQRQEEERRRKEEERRKNENNCPYFDNYGNCSYYPVNDSNTTTSVNPSEYFGSNDISYIDFESYLESYEDRYLPYFENPLRLQYTPLNRISLIETSRDLPFYLSGWTFYYEPDLGNFFIDFTKFGQFKYDVLILTAVGKTVKKVNKKFKYKGDEVRPVLVEDISMFSNTSIYSFNLKDLPKGEYELKLISKDGNTLKRQITIK